MVTGAEVTGVQGVQRSLFMKRLFAKMLPLVRSGRLGRHHLQSYRATLKSLPFPAWLSQDAGTVLTAVERAVEHPDYQFDASLAGDFGGLNGFIDWVSDAASTVWGAGKEVVSTAAEYVPIVSEIFGTTPEPLPVRITTSIPPAAPGTYPPVVEQVPGGVLTPTGTTGLPFGLTPITMGAILLGAYLLMRK